MSNSLFKWSFEKHDKKYYKIKAIHNEPVYLSSYLSPLKSNPNIKCPTPDMLVRVSNRITQQNISTYLWRINNVTLNKHTFYITHKQGDKKLYLAVCKETDTLILTTKKYTWNIINMKQLHNFHIDTISEYVIIDFKSTKALSIKSDKLSLEATHLWRLTQNPFKNVKESPFILNNLLQYSSFFVYSNVDKQYIAQSRRAASL